MPRVVRNFWIEAKIDGFEEVLGRGPRLKTGGFKMTIYQRDKGKIIKALQVEAIANKDGGLELRAYGPGRTESIGCFTER